MFERLKEAVKILRAPASYAPAARAGIGFEDILRHPEQVGPLGLWVPGGLKDLPPPSPVEAACAIIEHDPRAVLSGDGLEFATAQRPCPSCGGRGIVTTGNRVQPVVQCPNCGGGGTIGQVIRKFYDYVFPLATLTSGQQGVASTVQIQQDAPFESYWLVASSILASGAAGLYAVQITDQSTSKQLSNDFVNGENFAGTAQLPFALPEPYLIGTTASMTATFNERSVAGVNNVIQLVFRGYKVFPAGQPQSGSAGQIVNA
jgi:hypothetical protein